MRHSLLVAVTAALPLLGHAQSGTLISRTQGADIGTSIEGLLVDYSAASVSAAELARLGTDPVTVVENVRDFAVALQGDTPLSKKVFGVSITPARTTFAFPRISLAEYAGSEAGGNADLRSLPWRLLGSLTFGYAQGASQHGGVDFDRRAVSVETSAFFSRRDDPVVVVAESDCVAKAVATIPDEPPAAPAGNSGPVAVTRASAEKTKTAADAYNACVTPLLGELDQHWNRSRFSLSYATGWIRRADGSAAQESLGHTIGMGLVYGFDHVRSLKERAALTLVARRGADEPVLETLATGPVQHANSTLMSMRLSGGSSVFRGLIEASNAKSTSITTSQARFRRALGVDYRVTDGLWLGLRAGKQRKLDGSGEETGSFMTLSYSPSALLKR